MGFKNVAVVATALYVLFWLHISFNTPYDWLIFGIAACVWAYIYPDDPLKRFEAMARWVMREGGK